MTKLTENQEKALKEIKRLLASIEMSVSLINNSDELDNEWLLESIETSANCIKYKVSDFNEAAPHANIHPTMQNILNSFL